MKGKAKEKAKYDIDSRTKWCYCIGATGRDAAYALVSMYLITYIQYTMNLSIAQFGAISVAMMICLIWNAIYDLLMGTIIENTHFKHGKFKPWILAGAILNAIVIVALFTVRPQGWSFVAFFSVTYCLWGMTYTMNDIAYWGMLPSFSSDSKTRDMLLSLMSVFVCVGQFLVAGIVPTIIAGNAIQAYRVTALVVALGLILFQALTAFGVKERPRVDSKEKVTLKYMFKIFKRNDQLVPIGIATVLYNIGSNLLIIFGVNFFYFEFGYSEGGTLIFMFTVMYGLGTLFSQAIYSTLAKRLSRMQILKYSLIGIIIGYSLIIAYGYVLPKNVVLINAIGLLIFFCQGLFLLVTLVMLNNTIEYDEYYFNERHDSVISSVRSFAVKLAGALNQGISALVLIVSGIYAVSQNISRLEIDVGKQAMTSGQALAAANEYIAGVGSMQIFIFRLGMAIIPLAAIIATYILIKKKYSLDEKEYARIVAELEKRKQTA